MTDDSPKDSTSIPESREPFSAPVISKPGDGSIFSTHFYWIEGYGEPGTTVEIVSWRSGDGIVEYLGTAKVEGVSWKFLINFRYGTKTIFAWVRGEFERSNYVTYTNNRPPPPNPELPPPPIPNPPVITKPDPGETLPSPVTFSGTGYPGNFLVLLPDLGDTPLGYVQILDGIWSVLLDLAPGVHSIVAVQWNIFLQVSPRTEARAVKVPPPALTAVNVTPSGTSVKFSGVGYPTARVLIKIDSGPTVTAPPPGPVVNGIWETMATGWPNGTYELSAIQQVSDNASGWIDSEPYPFTHEHKLPAPYSVTSTPDYRTTLSGKGVLNATVSFYDLNQTTKIAPDAKVDSDNWSSQVLAEWGPTFKRAVHIRQSFNNLHSEWVVYLVTIAPKAPVIGKVEDGGLSPLFSGSCWLNAVVELAFSDSSTKHTATVSDTTWTYQRPAPFAEGVTHTVKATQTAAQQTSPPASEPFKAFRPMFAPVITDPGEDTKVSRDVTVRGTDGMKGATVRLFDVRFTKELGFTKLIEDGPWAIDLKTLAFDLHTVEAMQEIDERESARSEWRKFTVVLMEPGVTSPLQGRSLTRTSEIEGRGLPGARVDVFLGDAPQPLLKDIPVDAYGYWGAGVTLPVGNTTIWAKQYFDDQISENGLPITYRVVPAPPSLETPAVGEHAGQHTVVSGFGVSGDTVTVMLGDATSTVLGQTTVEDDRTWSIVVVIDHPGGDIELVVVASLDGFGSAGSPGRPVILGTLKPDIDSPSEGQWADNPVHFTGQGPSGVGQVVSWYNPDQVWAPNLSVSNGTWQGDATSQLPPGGNWYVFWQTLTDDPGGAKLSDKTQSQRFEVHPSTSKFKKGIR